jgi:hypothetical protein
VLMYFGYAEFKGLDLTNSGTVRQTVVAVPHWFRFFHILIRSLLQSLIIYIERYNYF